MAEQENTKMFAVRDIPTCKKKEKIESFCDSLGADLTGCWTN